MPYHVESITARGYRTRRGSATLRRVLSGRASCVLAAALCVAAFATKNPARAQTRASPSGDGLPALDYHAPAGCPERAAFVERVRARQRSAASAKAADLQ